MDHHVSTRSFTISTLCKHSHVTTLLERPIKVCPDNRKWQGLTENTWIPFLVINYVDNFASSTSNYQQWEKLAGFLGQSVRESLLAAHGLIIVRIISHSLPSADSSHFVVRDLCIEGQKQLGLFIVKSMIPVCLFTMPITCRYRTGNIFFSFLLKGSQS